MRNTLLCISVFSIPLCAMELPEPGPDAALVNNAVDIITAALGTQNLNGQSSSLQDSCAKAIVHNWHAVLKKKAMTAEALLDKLAAHNILEKFEHALICPNNLPYPTSIARDADMAVYDFEHAVLSDDGRWAIGWVKSKNQGGMLARFDLYSCDMHNNKRTLCLEGAYLGNLNYVFLSNNSVLLRDKDSLYECGAKEFFEKGYDALKRVFTRIDGKKYGHPFFATVWKFSHHQKWCALGRKKIVSK